MTTTISRSKQQRAEQRLAASLSRANVTTSRARLRALDERLAQALSRAAVAEETSGRLSAECDSLRVELGHVRADLERVHAVTAGQRIDAAELGKLRKIMRAVYDIIGAHLGGGAMPLWALAAGVGALACWTIAAGLS